jgi:DNA (cytosine-5)-methyltransferase 1
VNTHRHHSDRSPDHSPITATDLFSGAGGSSTGLDEAGVQVAVAANHVAEAIADRTDEPDTDGDDTSATDGDERAG